MDDKELMIRHHIGCLSAELVSAEHTARSVAHLAGTVDTDDVRVVVAVSGNEAQQKLQAVMDAHSLYQYAVRVVNG